MTAISARVAKRATEDVIETAVSSIGIVARRQHCRHRAAHLEPEHRMLATHLGGASARRLRE
jgi:hypothetical protein